MYHCAVIAGGILSFVCPWPRPFFYCLEYSQENQNILLFETQHLVRQFFNTGAVTTLKLRDIDGDPQEDNEGHHGNQHGVSVIANNQQLVGGMITAESKVFPTKQSDKRPNEKYDIIRLEGDWEPVKGDAWTPRLDTAMRNWGGTWEEVRSNEDTLLNEHVQRKWTEAERKTVAATLLFIVMHEGGMNEDAIRPAPSKASKVGKVWEWAVVKDLQSRHDTDGVNRAQLLIDVLDKNKFLPKVVMTVGYEIGDETNLRASSALLTKFGGTYMAVDSIEELASYSMRQVILLLFGVATACALALLLDTGAGFFLLAVLCASSLEQEIDFRLFKFALERAFTSRKPPKARPGPASFANYLMVAGFGLVEAAYDDYRIPPMLANAAAVFMTGSVVVLALPPLVFVCVIRRRSEYNGPYALSSPERQDWVRNSVGYFYGSCRECILGGAGRGYRCGDQADGRLFNWLAACSIKKVMWTGTNAGGVHHSATPEMRGGYRWAVVG